MRSSRTILLIENALESEIVIKCKGLILMDIKLIFPTHEYENQVMAYRRDFLENDDLLAGVSGLSDYENYSDWISLLEKNLTLEENPQGLVPSTTLLAIRETDNKLVGIIDIRHRLNDNLMYFGGHIGYSVARDERKKGVATKMLSLALDECKRLGIKEVLITCDKKNLGSAKTIINNGGVLDDEIEGIGRVTQRYWINLS